jgi:hypothetical protein
MRHHFSDTQILPRRIVNVAHDRHPRKDGQHGVGLARNRKLGPVALFYAQRAEIPVSGLGTAHVISTDAILNSQSDRGSASRSISRFAGR